MTMTSNGAKPVVEVTEFADPGCPWSWTSEPRIRWVRRRYGDHVLWRRVFGVQLNGPEGSDTGEDPEALRQRWLSVAAHAQAPVATRLLRAHASTRPADRAAKVAEHQGAAVADAVLRRLREAFFVVGQPPDTREAIATALEDVFELDLAALLDGLDAPETMVTIEADFEETRTPDPYVIDLDDPGPHAGAARDDGYGRLRYGFPTLLLRSTLGRRIVPGWRELWEYRAAFEALDPALADLPDGDFKVAEALALHRSLSVADLELLTGDAAHEPDGAIRVETATTPLWMSPDEAEHLEWARVAAAPA
jgi:predicted DsbA family dithiol-disulfide isomerase